MSNIENRYQVTTRWSESFADLEGGYPTKDEAMDRATHLVHIDHDIEQCEVFDTMAQKGHPNLWYVKRTTMIAAQSVAK